ncbi:MAG: PrpF domain-containing protein [Psittacicella sp.]
MNKTPCFIVRGGTSKGIYFKESDMPQNRDNWEAFLLEVMGSPDMRQINGLGGANSLTSKVAIINNSQEDGVDLNYTFAQVSINKSLVDFKNNCGNISSGVATYAIASGLISPKDGICSVNIFNTNTQKLIKETLEVRNGRAVEIGNLAIPGVPGTGAKIDVSFYDPQGAVTKKLLPTGNPKDKIQTSIGEIEISIVDSANPLVFMNAKDLGLKGTELPSEYTPENLKLIEEVRSIACEMCGFASKEEATNISPAIPKSTIIASPQDLKDMSGNNILANEIDLIIRMMSMQKPHQALAVTGAVCSATAAKIKGTLVSEIVNIDKDLTVAHPGGIMHIGIEEENSKLRSVSVERTARVIMEGFVYTDGKYF